MEENPKKFSIRWKRILRGFLSDGRESLEVLVSDARVCYCRQLVVLMVRPPGSFPLHELLKKEECSKGIS